MDFAIYATDNIGVKDKRILLTGQNKGDKDEQDFDSVLFESG